MNQERCKPFTIKQNRRNNRTLQLNRKGHKPSIRKTRYKFQPGDIVRFDKLIYPVVGVHSYGTQIKLKDELGNILNTNIKNVKLITYGKGLQFLLATEKTIKTVKKSVKTIKETFKKEVVTRVEKYVDIFGNIVTKETIMKKIRTVKKTTEVNLSGQHSLFEY